MFVTAGFETVFDRRADQHLQVDGIFHPARHRDIARDDRLAAGDGPEHSGGGGHIVNDDAYVYGQAATGDFPAGQGLDQLFLAAGRVAHRHLDQLQVVVHQSGQGLVGGGHVLFDGDDAMRRLHGMPDHARARHHIAGLFLNQPGVAGDVRLTLDSVDDQGVNGVVHPLHQFDMGRKPGPSQAGDAAIPDQLLQLPGLHRVVALGGADVEPGVLAIGLQHDARGLVQGGMRHRMLRQADDLPGGAGMHRHAHIAPGLGHHLALQHLVAGLHQRLRRQADMLLQGQKHPLRQGMQQGRLLVCDLLARL